MKLKIPSQSTILAVVISLTAFLQLQPYFVWKNNAIGFYLIIVLFIMGNLFIVTGSLQVRDKNLVLLIYAIILAIYINYHDIRIKIILVNLVYYIPIFVYLLTSTENKQKILYFFSFIFAIALLPSIILYVLHLFNIELSWSYLEPLNPLKTEAGIYYKQYFGAITYFNPYNIMTGKLYRLCGMFDEPGVIGTVSALILIAKGYEIRKNYINKILLTAGLLSFSLFFYMITIIYFLINAILAKKLKSFATGVFILIIFSLFNFGIIENDFINNTIINRIGIENGTMVGDNRTSEYFDSTFSEFMKSKADIVMFGMGTGTSSLDEGLASSASWKKFVIDRGFVGLTMLITFFMLITLMYKQKNGIILLLIMIACIYQRPGVFELPFILIYFGGITQRNELINKSIKILNEESKL